MQKIIFSFLLGTLFLISCGEKSVEEVSSKKNDDPDIEKTEEVAQVETGKNDSDIPFFYQYVGKFTNGVGTNAVRVGKSEDGVLVNSYGVDALDWELSKSNTNQYGDPVYSYLSNGNWAMTARASRGPSDLIYGESSCPVIDDSKVISFASSTASGCKKIPALNGGKTSQVFDVNGSNYIFHMIMGEIFLANLTNPQGITSICVPEAPVGTLSDLGSGESTKIISSNDSSGLVLSDAAIAQREDETWVLFVKGIAKNSMGSACPGASLCELCARGIYRSTSSDLINWTSLEKVVGEASVPEAVTMPDGTVRLYWQDFSAACTADDIQLANNAAISTAYETDSYDLSDVEQVSFPDEAFESDSSIHYATNGNPITIPNESAMKALEACMY